ncbi:MAG: hypothetical protein PHN88_08795 [Ignavibacteria bacterium]|nr:hypothetical protein [Ignavibacteria bacterium]
MKNTELYKLLINFTAIDFDEFELFLLSPLHNKNKPLIVLFQIIKAKKNLLAERNYIKLTQQIKKKTGYSDATIKKLISFLSNAVLEYYKLKSASANDISSKATLNDFLLRNGDYDTLKKMQSKLTKELDDIEKSNAENYFNAYLHNMNLFNSSIMRMKYQSTVEAGSRLRIINDACENLVIFTLIKLTILYANYILNSIDSGKDKVSGFTVNLKELYKSCMSAVLDTKNKKHISIFDLHMKAFECFEKIACKENYLIYKEAFNRNIGILDDESKYSNFNLLLGYCYASQRMTDEDKFFYREELELLTFYIKQGLYKNELTSDLPPVMYRNYVTLCMDIKDMKSMYSFIENYSNELNVSSRVDFVNFALTHYYYGIQNYQKALKHINSVALNKFVYKYDLINIEMKIYFEKADFFSLDRIFHNYRETVKKDLLLTKYDKSRFMIFFKHLSELIRIINAPESKERQFSLEYLRSTITKENSFVMRKWMLEKLDEKLNSHSKTSEIIS